jgi:hypothetical protein
MNRGKENVSFEAEAHEQKVLDADPITLMSPCSKQCFGQ